MGGAGDGGAGVGGRGMDDASMGGAGDDGAGVGCACMDGSGMAGAGIDGAGGVSAGALRTSSSTRSLGLLARSGSRVDARLRLRLESERTARVVGNGVDGRDLSARSKAWPSSGGDGLTVGGVSVSLEGVAAGCLCGRCGLVAGRGAGAGRGASDGKRKPMTGRCERSTTRAVAAPASSTTLTAASTGNKRRPRWGWWGWVRRCSMRRNCADESPRSLRPVLRNSRASRSSADAGGCSSKVMADSSGCSA